MDQSLLRLQQTMRTCTRCLEAGHAISPGAVFSGSATARIMLIGQAPGITEVEARRPFNAGSGRRLFQWLGDAGWEENTFRARHYMTAVTKCYPGKDGSGKGDRVPSREEQALCRPYLDEEIRLVQPRLIILVGKLATSLLFPKRTPLREIIGTAVYFQGDGVNPPEFDLDRGERTLAFRGETDGQYVVPLPHPSGASLWPNQPANQRLIARAITILRDLRIAWQL